MSGVSVIIPTYNRVEHVCCAIDSALAQTEPPLEVVVVDDGSTDGTGEVLERRYAGRIRYIHQVNAGVSAARNTALRVARGEWVAFLDSDDEWLPNKLQIQMTDLRAHPTLVAHVTNGIIVMRSGEEVDFFKARNRPHLGVSDCVLRQPLQYVLEQTFLTATYVVRRDVAVEEGLFDESMSMFEDLDFFLRVAVRGPFGVSNLPLLRKYQRGSGAPKLSDEGAKDPVKSLGNVVKAGETLYRRALSGDDRRLVSRFLGGSRFRLGLAQRAGGDRRGARRSFMHSVRDDPCLRTAAKALLAIGFGKAGEHVVGLIGKRRGPGFWE